MAPNDPSALCGRARTSNTTRPRNNTRRGCTGRAKLSSKVRIPYQSSAPVTLGAPIPREFNLKPGDT